MTLRARLAAVVLLAGTAVAATHAVPTPTASATPVASAATATKPLRVLALSNRPDLVSGGDVRVAVDVPRAVAPTLRVTLNGADVTRRFVATSATRREAVLTGLRLGRNSLRALARGYYGSLVVTNHAQGGPVFSGPQTRTTAARSAPATRSATSRRPTPTSTARPTR